ncbi:MAG: hypothetical protein C0605_11285 [Hyphomicrobiales bacterium]|nr:MAG: hypothetical protein C0605_11285 [Hyphomicrobiales bacterium]
MVATYVMRIYAGLVTLLTLAGLAYVIIAPPASLGVSRDGVPHFTPPVLNPETGKGISLDELVRHYKGQ